jgi:uncharacterized RDD family membrane protein YckC
MRGQYSADGQWWWDGQRWVAAGQAGPAAAVVPAVRYAGFWIRLVAWFIDSVVVLVGLSAVSVAFGVLEAALSSRPGAQNAPGLFGPVFDLLAIVGAWLYFSLLHSSRWQASLGMMALSLSVVGNDGGRVSFARATGRYFASLISGLFCYLGYLLIAFTGRKQALHDLIASTFVVHGRPQPGRALQPAGLARGSAEGAGLAAAVVVSGALVLVLMSIVVIVILLTMGRQIENVFSNVVIALQG